jgi:hypothetical protein
MDRRSNVHLVAEPVHTFRRRAHVAKAINSLIELRTGATQSRVLEELGKIAFSDIADVVSVQDGVYAAAGLPRSRTEISEAGWRPLWRRRPNPKYLQTQNAP